MNRTVVYRHDVRAQARRDVLLVTLAGTILRLAFIGDPGHIVDLTTFGQWALAAADNPWDRAYEVTNANYPPGALLFFEFIGRSYRLAVHADPDGRALRIALKVPSVMFDLIGGALAYAIARRFVGHREALVATASIDVNPAIIYDSSLWGQNDSITTATALAALWCILARWRVAAWIALAFAVLNKPPVIVLAPLFVLEALGGTGLPERRRRLIATLIGFAGAVACGYLTAIPFYSDRTVWGVYSRMFEWYRIGSSLYPFSSANAFNIYALAGDFFASDNAGFPPLKFIADLCFIGLAVTIYARYARRRDDRALLEAAFLIMLGFFLVLTEMHERYLIYSLFFVAPLAALERHYLRSAIALTVTQWLNLEYSLTYMWVQSDKPAGIDPNEFAPVLVHLCALTNVAVFGLGMRGFLRSSPKTRDGPIST